MSYPPKLSRTRLWVFSGAAAAVVVFAAIGLGTGNGAGLLDFTITAAVIAAYWLPTCIARVRHVTNLGSVAVVNGFLGWTVAGWVVALAMAARTVPPVR